jgi:hypothetical protein
MKKQKEIKIIVDNIVNFMVANIDDPRYDVNTEHAYKELEQYNLDNIFYTPLINNFPDNVWTFDRSSWSRDVSESEVKEINKDIENKNPKYERYKINEKLDECWLLIHSDANEISQMDFPTDRIEWIKSRIIASPFDRIFFLDYPKKMVVQLK